MALSYDGSTYDSPSIDLNLPTALTFDASAPGVTQPVADSSKAPKSTFQDAVNGVLALFDDGIAVYNKVAGTIGTTQAQAAQQKAAAQAAVTVAQNNALNPPILLGLNQSQLLWIVVGLSAVLIVPRLIRRG